MPSRSGSAAASPQTRRKRRSRGWRRRRLAQHAVGEIERDDLARAVASLAARASAWPVPAPRSSTIAGSSRTKSRRSSSSSRTRCLQHRRGVVGARRAAERAAHRAPSMPERVGSCRLRGRGAADRKAATSASTSAGCDRNGACPLRPISWKRAAGRRAASSCPAPGGVRRSCSPAMTSVGSAMRGRTSRRSASRRMSRPAASAAPVRFAVRREPAAQQAQRLLARSSPRVCKARKFCTVRR